MTTVNDYYVHSCDDVQLLRNESAVDASFTPRGLAAFVFKFLMAVISSIYTI